MTNYKVKMAATELAPKKIKSNALNSFQPAKENLSAAYFERNPDSMWDQSKRENDKNKITGLKWTILPAEEETNLYRFIISFTSIIFSVFSSAGSMVHLSPVILFLSFSLF